MRLFGGRSGGLTSGPGAVSGRHHGQLAVTGTTQYQGGQPVPYSAASVTVNGVPQWVSDVWDYYGATGELHFTANFLGACLSRCSLRLGVLDKDNNIGPAFDEDGNPMPGVDPALADLGARMIAGLRTAPGVQANTPVGGQSLLLSRMGTNLGSVAECYLIGTGERVDNMAWEVLSSVELVPIDTPQGEKQRFRRRRTRATQSAYEDFTPDFYLRVYRPHPAWSGEADSSNVPLRPKLERLVLLDAEGVSDSKSRLKGPGVYWLPSEIDFPGTDEDPEGEDFMTNEFIETASKAIQDPTSASRHVPIVARAPGELIDHIRHDKFGYEDDRLIEKRQAAVNDFARGTDLPFESTVGMSGTTFANAFFIDEQLARLHVVPWLELIEGFLTGGWLTPALAIAGGVRKNAAGGIPPEITRYVVWHDISGLVTHPNPDKVVSFAYGTDTNPNSLISARGSRRMLGIPEADRPTPEEIAERLERAQKLRARSEIGGRQPDGGDGDPTPEDPGDAPDEDEEIGKRVMGLADYVVTRAVERLGSKLRSKVQGQAQRSRPEFVEAAKRIDGVDASDVARVLGPQMVESLGGARSLMNGEFSTFERTVLSSFMDAGRDDAADLASAAVRMVEAVALARLFNPAVRLDSRVASGFLDQLMDRRPE